MPHKEDISVLNAALHLVLEHSTVGRPTRQRIARTLTANGLANAAAKALVLSSVPLRCYAEVRVALDDEAGREFTLAVIRAGELLGRPPGDF
ncbi:hypothetical protein AB0H83_44040 [Dactylosporangium sp. NPDC050688]|uniref:hypothetical protein n=1 Tax=Dactylosporangium sp. NPDC050688 TaxID=3157217 RepID=UPI0033CBB715